MRAGAGRMGYAVSSVDTMTLTLDLPEDVAAILRSDGRNLEKVALEALAVEEYHARRLSDAQFRRVLRRLARLLAGGFRARGTADRPPCGQSREVIVVSDTSPINYLTLIGETDLLRQLYSEVLIPPAVDNELLSPDSPPPVRQFVASRPRWLSVVAPGSNSDPRLAELDEGEREAIVLALNHGADLLLIDERDGRRVALACGVEAAGTLRVSPTAQNEVSSTSKTHSIGCERLHFAPPRG